MEFDGTARVRRSWRTPCSMEFRWIQWNCSCHRNWRTPSSMEFHGIPWNCSCHRNWRTPSSMEFHWTARVTEIGALQIPWNSTEPLVSAKLAHSRLQNLFWIRINFCGIIFNFAGWINFRKLISTLYIFESHYHQLDKFDILKNHISKYCCWYLIDDYMSLG